MKKFYRLFATLVTAAVMTFTGCSGVQGLNAVSYENGRQCRISIGVEGMEFLTDGAKTIMPATWTDEATAALKFYISGKSSFGRTLDRTAILTAASDNKVALSYDKWELTLEAEKTITGTDTVILKGTSVIDVTQGGTSVRFILESVKNVAGTVSVKVNYTDTDNAVKAVKCGIYNILDGTPVEDNEGDACEDLLTGADMASGFTYSKNVNPGKYVFKIKFLSDIEASKAVLCGNYTETVIVDAGNTSSKEINITDIATKAQAPSDFDAYIKDGSENYIEGFYTVKLTWDDTNTKNEENYVITIDEYDLTAVDGTPSKKGTYAVLGVINDAENKNYLYTNRDFCVEGSLLAGNNTYTVKLPLGRLFDISIQSENFVGKSAVVNRAGSSSALDGYNLVAAADKINRLFVSYDLDGGTLNLNDSTVVEGKPHVEYKNYKDAMTGLLVTKTSTIKTNNNTGSGNPRITKQYYTFDKFVESGSTTAATAYNNVYKNQFFTVVYTNNYEATVDYTLPEYSDMARTAVTITGSGVTDLAEVPSGTALTITIDPTNAVADGPAIYDEYKILVDGSVVYSNVTPTYTYSGDKIWVPMSHEITVMARLAGKGEWYSQSYNFTIVR